MTYPRAAVDSDGSHQSETAVIDTAATTTATESVAIAVETALLTCWRYAVRWLPAAIPARNPTPNSVFREAVNQTIPAVAPRRIVHRNSSR